MKVLKRCTQLLCVLLLLGLLLAACGPKGAAGPTPAPNGSEPSTPASGAAGNPLPLENRRGQGGLCTSSAADGYYRVSKRVSFYDAAAGTSVILCAQPGCSHTDETCQAWIGDVTSYTEYHGQIYAVRGRDSVQFIRKDLANGHIAVLAEWKATDTASHIANLGVISDGRAVIYLNSQVVREGDEDFRMDTVRTTWLFDLETGEKRELFPGEGGLSVLALSASHAVVQYTEDTLSPEEYAAQHGGDLTDYGTYTFWGLKQELRLYDPDFIHYTVLTDSERGFVPYSEGNMTYGKELVYAEGDGVFLVDVDTGDSRRLLTQEGIVNYWLMDRKVFLITREGDVRDPASPITVWYAGTDDGQLVRLENGGRTDYMVFGICYEGQSFFMDSMQAYITKTDFYAENYETE